MESDRSVLDCFLLRKSAAMLISERLLNALLLHLPTDGRKLVVKECRKMRTLMGARVGEKELQKTVSLLRRRLVEGLRQGHLEALREKLVDYLRTCSLPVKEEPGKLSQAELALRIDMFKADAEEAEQSPVLFCDPKGIRTAELEDVFSGALQGDRIIPALYVLARAWDEAFDVAEALDDDSHSLGDVTEASMHLFREQLAEHEWFGNPFLQYVFSEEPIGLDNFRRLLNDWKALGAEAFRKLEESKTTVAPAPAPAPALAPAAGSASAVGAAVKNAWGTSAPTASPAPAALSAVAAAPAAAPTVPKKLVSKVAAAVLVDKIFESARAPEGAKASSGEEEEKASPAAAEPAAPEAAPQSLQTPDSSSSTEAAPASEAPAAASVSESASEATQDIRAFVGAPVTVFDDEAKGQGEASNVPGLQAIEAEGLTRSLVYATVTGGSFTNLFFAAKVRTDGTLSVYADAEREERFPKYGAVNIRYPQNKRPPLSEGQFYLYDWHDNDLRINDDGDGTPRDDFVYRVDGELLRRQGRLFSADEMKTYVVAYPADSSMPWDKPVYLHAQPSGAGKYDRFLKGASVLVCVENRLYGPFTAVEDARHHPFVQPTTELLRTKGVLSGYENARSILAGPEAVTVDVQGSAVTLVSTERLPKKLFDTMSDEALLATLTDAARRPFEDNERLAQYLEAGKYAADLFGADARVAAARVARLERLLQGFDVGNRLVDGAGFLLDTFFERLNRRDNPHHAAFDALVERIAEHPALLKHLESYETVTAGIARLQETSKTLENETTRKAAESAALDDEIARKRREVVSAAAASKAEIEAEVAELSQRKATLVAEIDRASDCLKEAFANPGAFAFDGAIASKLMEAAAHWEAEEETKSFTERARSIARLPLFAKEGEALKHHLLESVGRYRPYEENAVLNLFILLTQNFLTILSGPPGAGKTSICGILAHALGLTTLHRQPAIRRNSDLWKDPYDADRYLPVSVERGWTSKRDFIGYFNPLTHSFESPDVRRYEAFAELNAEKREGCECIPYVMLLDEANLSPMEYYFADFMNICDERSNLSFLSLGDKMRYAVPDTLRFLATINDDFTTENLSPRLLDRAAIATLPDVSWEEGAMPAMSDPDFDEDRPIVSWRAMKALFGADGLGLNTKADALLRDVYRVFSQLSGYESSVSPRTRIACARYVAAASRVFRKSGDRPTYVEAVDYAVAQRLLPRVHGSGPRYRERLDRLAEHLREADLRLSGRLLDRIIVRGDMEMDFYRFCG